jgi:excisionase family DNA binding protein
MLTARAAAERLGVPLRTFYALVAGGKIPAVRYSPRCTRYDPADLDAFKAACRSTTTPGRNAGDSSSTAWSQAADTDLVASFRSLGIELGPKPTRARKKDASTRLRLVSSSRGG